MSPHCRSSIDKTTGSTPTVDSSSKVAHRPASSCGFGGAGSAAALVRHVQSVGNGFKEETPAEASPIWAEQRACVTGKAAKMPASTRAVERLVTYRLPLVAPARQTSDGDASPDSREAPGRTRSCRCQTARRPTPWSALPPMPWSETRVERGEFDFPANERSGNCTAGAPHPTARESPLPSAAPTRHVSGAPRQVNSSGMSCSRLMGAGGSWYSCLSASTCSNSPENGDNR